MILISASSCTALLTSQEDQCFVIVVAVSVITLITLLTSLTVKTIIIIMIILAAVTSLDSDDETIHTHHASSSPTISQVIMSRIAPSRTDTNLLQMSFIHSEYKF